MFPIDLDIDEAGGHPDVSFPSLQKNSCEGQCFDGLVDGSCADRLDFSGAFLAHDASDGAGNGTCLRLGGYFDERCHNDFPL